MFAILSFVEVSLYLFVNVFVKRVYIFVKRILSGCFVVFGVILAERSRSRRSW